VDQQLTYDSVCRYVGRLYLANQQELERLQAVYETRVKQLEEEAKAERERRERAERDAAEATRLVRQ